MNKYSMVGQPKEATMKYHAPTTVDKKPYWVPVVCKNRDSLVGYIRGMKFILGTLDGMKNTKNNEIETEIIIDYGQVDPCLDSSRFNDITPGLDKRESEMSNEELKMFRQGMIKKALLRGIEHHPDNDPSIFKDVFLKLECAHCEMGFYQFEEPEDVPEENFYCQICGRKLIDYTNREDSDYEFDG